MKKIFCFIALLAGVTMFTSCGDDDATYTATPVLEVSNADVMFEAEGGTGSVTVNTSGSVSATVESGSWLSASVSGSTVTLTAPLNSSLNGRSAKIVITADGKKAEVTATQKGSVYGLAGGWDYEVVDSANAFVNVPVVHTEGVTVQSLTDWLTARFNTATDNIEVVAQSNESDQDRVGYVAFKTGIINDTIAVTQLGIVFDIDSADIAVSSEAVSKKVIVKHSRPIKLASAPEWVGVKGSDKSGTMTLTLDIAENTGAPRTGEIVLTSGPLQRTITISQAEATGDNQPTFADEVYGSYTFVYYDAAGTQDWAYFDAEITKDGLTLYYPVNANVILPYVVPIEIDNANKVVKAGPNGSYLGKYGASYFIYLAWYNMNAGPSGYDVESLALGTLSTEEEEGELTTYLDWAGTFGENTIDGWMLQAFAAEEYAAGSYVGGLDYLIKPYMVKNTEEAPAAARRGAMKRAGVITSRGHKVYPATYHGALKQLKK